DGPSDRESPGEPMSALVLATRGAAPCQSAPSPSFPDSGPWDSLADGCMPRIPRSAGPRGHHFLRPKARLAEPRGLDKEKPAIAAGLDPKSSRPYNFGRGRSAAGDVTAGSRRGGTSHGTRDVRGGLLLGGRGGIPARAGRPRRGRRLFGGPP